MVGLPHQQLPSCCTSREVCWLRLGAAAVAAAAQATTSTAITRLGFTYNRNKLNHTIPYNTDG